MTEKQTVKMEVMNLIALVKIELKHSGVVMVTLIVLKVKTKLDVLVCGSCFSGFMNYDFFQLIVVGCAKDEFSCNDWNPRYRKSTCIPLKQRCDGIEQCPVGFDEIDCSVLTDTLEEHKVCEALLFTLVVI